MMWLAGTVGSTVVESDEQILVGTPDDGNMALYEVCFKQLIGIFIFSAFDNLCNQSDSYKCTI